MAAGQDAVHVRMYEMHGSSDEQVVDRARRENRISFCRHQLWRNSRFSRAKILQQVRMVARAGALPNF